MPTKEFFNARFTKARGVFSKIVLKLFLVHKVTKKFIKSQCFPLPPPVQPVCQFLSVDFIPKKYSDS